MNQCFSISSLSLKIFFLAIYLFAAVFGVGVHVHETLLHYHDGVEQHAHQFVWHAHNDLSNSNATPVIASRDSAHEHDVPTLQLSGVHNPSASQKYSPQAINTISLATEAFLVNRDDCIVVTIMPDASPPLHSHLKSNHIGRAPPTA